MLRAEYPNPLRLRGSHTIPGRGGTCLSFDVFLTRYHEDEVTALIDTSTTNREGHPHNTQFSATGLDEYDALLKLVSYLRRCADAIEGGLDTVRLPAAIPRMPALSVTVAPTPGEEEP